MKDPKITEITERKLIGIRTAISLSNDKTRELWQQFMPRRNEIAGFLNNRFYSMQVYDKNQDFNSFTPNTMFEKWAAVEVVDFGTVPEGMEPYLLASGKYAVFIHRGPASAFQKTYQHIFGVWLPNSDYELDSRAHFEILEEHYDPNDPNAEEEVWIPIK